MDAVSCTFYVRTPVGDEYRYESVGVGGYHGHGQLRTTHPPLVGDLIHLWDTEENSGGTFRVLERSWLHSSYGSANWALGTPASTVGPSLDIVVEAADGIFRKQADRVDSEQT